MRLGKIVIKKQKKILAVFFQTVNKSLKIKSNLLQKSINFRHTDIQIVN